MVDASRHHRTLTDYSGFGVEVRYDCAGDPALARALVDAGTGAGLRVAASARGVDSGVAVPLRFLFPDKSVPVVPISVADRPLDECRAWGAVIHRALEAWPDPVLFVVGGLLSFDPHAARLAREVKAQRDFDERMLAMLREGRWSAIGDERRSLVAAGRRTTGESVLVENELRHFEILHGYLGADVRGDVRCYEPSPGVGAALVAFDVPGVEVPSPDAGDDDWADFPVDEDDADGGGFEE
jgi:aromatic ring-opening dioxygenase catalytic subunit (LigB family)